MSSCTLQIGPRVALVSPDGPPAAEFALFDADDIELAQDEEGVLRESGYRTLAVHARRRLAVAGVTAAMADEAAALLRPSLAAIYARGPLVRRVVAKLEAAELFEGRRYDATLRRYEGGWLDLPLLANDAGLASGTALFQALSLAAMLAEVADDAPVTMNTTASALRLGERALRKRALEGVVALPRALSALAARAQDPEPPSEGGGPSKAEIVAHLRARIETCVREETRTRLQQIERALARRDPPTHGPLADPEAWALEQRLAAGETDGVLERLEALERARGRTPGTIYLRAKASLLTKHEAPRAIAERVSALVLSMNEFAELELLAAQAWAAAGEMRRAQPYARDLMANPKVHDELRLAAEELLAVLPGAPATGAPSAGPRGVVRPVPRAAPGRGSGAEADLDEEDIVRNSAVPAESAPRLRTHKSEPPIELELPPALELDLPLLDLELPPRRSSFPARAVSETSEASTPRVEHEVLPVPTPPPPPRLETPPPAHKRPPPPVSLTPPPIPPRTPSEPPPRSLTPPDPPAAPQPPRSVPPVSLPPMTMASPRPQGPISRPTTRSPVPPRVDSPSPSPPPPAPPIRVSSPGLRRSDTPRPPSDPPPLVRPSQWPTSLRAPREEPYRPEHVDHTPTSTRAAPQSRFMRGASLPPHQTEPPRVPKAPIVPRVDVEEAEVLETLSLPASAYPEMAENRAPPRTALEARVRCTMWSRELARQYRIADRVVLRLDAEALHLVQEHLLTRFASRVIRTRDEAYEAELHGAFLAELLARTLDAEWVDIGPTELGYWAMAIPTPDGNARRVWPFGRVLRVISGADGDLVGYYHRLRELRASLPRA